MMLATLWKKKKQNTDSSDECQSQLRRCVKDRRGGCPGLPVPNSPYGLCGRKATLNERDECVKLVCKAVSELCACLVSGHCVERNE